MRLCLVMRAAQGRAWRSEASGVRVVRLTLPNRLGNAAMTATRAGVVVQNPLAPIDVNGDVNSETQQAQLASPATPALTITPATTVSIDASIKTPSIVVSSPAEKDAQEVPNSPKLPPRHTTLPHTLNPSITTNVSTTADIADAHPMEFKVDFDTLARGNSLESPIRAPPEPSIKLERGETVLFVKHRHKIRNIVSYRWRDCLMIPGSVLPAVAMPAFLITAWGAWWIVAYQVLQWKGIAIQNLLITILSVVIGLLLVFRTNTAYDRYYEARRLWGSMFTHTRNLGRFVWVTVITKSPEGLAQKFGAINLLLAYAVSTKHYLREEPGYHYDDLYHLMQHLPDFRPGAMHPNLDNIPLEITFHLSSFISKCRTIDAIDPVVAAQMMTSLSVLVDCLSQFERIRNSPIPRAYSIHLKQTVLLYLLSLPFQLVGPLGWATIPVMFLAAFTLLGIEAIGGEIENPFGYDPNDLDLDQFCQTIKSELEQIVDRPTSLDPGHWVLPVQLHDFTRLVNIKKRYPSKPKTTTNQ